MGAAHAPGRLAIESGSGDEPRHGLSERVYGGLLRAYSAPFRRRYADEMVQLFADQLRDARTANGSTGIAVAWYRTLVDLVSSAIGERLRGDRGAGQSLTTFEPSRGMRFLGVLGIVGGILLLWAFIDWNPFAERGANTVRLVLFWLAGAAVTVAFHRRLAAVAPRLAPFATSSVVFTSAWNVAELVIAIDRDSPFSGTFGFIGFVASFLGWIAASLYGLAMLRTWSAWKAIPGWAAIATRIAALVLIVGGPIGTFGMDRLGLTHSAYGELFGTLGALGVGGVGLGWLLLGAALAFGGRSARAGRGDRQTA